MFSLEIEIYSAVSNSEYICSDIHAILDAVIFTHILDTVIFMHILDAVVVGSLCYVQSVVCVMCRLHQSLLCVAFSVSGSPLERLVAALLIPADVSI